MKIAFVIQDLFSLGAQYVTALMVRGFIAKGYEVDLIVSQVHNDRLQMGLKPFEVPEQTNWIFLPHRKARNNIWALSQYLRKTDAVALISMSSNYADALALAKRISFSKAKIYNVEHNGGIGVSFDGKTVIDAPKKFSLKWWRSKFFTQPFERILTVSTGNADAIARMFDYPREKVEIVYNPVIDDVFYQKIKETAEIHPWLKNKVCPTFVAAGAHTKLKNHLLLLKAFQLLNKKQPVRLLLFGRGELTDSYADFIREHRLETCICLAGYTNNLPANLCKSDGLIVSSNVESFSVVLVEALACGIPVISTDCPYGPREILKNGLYGMLVPVDNPKAMADAVLETLQTKTVAPKDSWKKFELDKIVARYERALGFTHIKE